MKEAFCVLNSGWAKGDNQFTEHVTYKIVAHEITVAQIKLTRFDWKNASFFNTQVSWVSKKGSVIERCGKYIFDKESKTVNLSPTIGQFLYSKDPILFIDDIVLNEDYCSLSSLNSLINSVISEFSGSAIYLLIPDWIKISDSLFIGKENAISFFYSLGLIPLDDEIMFRYMDAPYNTIVDNHIAEISKLMV